jgi:hypothetical protein
MQYKKNLILTSPCKCQRIEFLINGNIIKVTEVIKLNHKNEEHPVVAGDFHPNETEFQIAEYLKLGWKIYSHHHVPLDNEQSQLAHSLFVQELNDAKQP